jgi:Spy/CpxP family protein refolding chaperone
MDYRFFQTWRPAALLAVLVAVLTGLVPGPAWAQGKWWQSERFQRELRLTQDQISRVEEVFQAAIPELRRQKKILDRLEDDLSRLIDTSADEAAVMQEADRVEAVRSELSKSRTRMLLRIRSVLSAEQRLKLAALHEEWDRERKRQDRRQ